MLVARITVAAAMFSLTTNFLGAKVAAELFAQNRQHAVGFWKYMLNESCRFLRDIQFRLKNHSIPTCVV